jgi:hypothetical protein
MRFSKDEPARAGRGAANESAETMETRIAVVRTVGFMVAPHPKCLTMKVLDLNDGSVISVTKGRCWP